MPSLAASDGGQGRTAFLDNGGRVGQRGWSSATYAFAESSTERSRLFAALRKRSQGTVGAKRARQEQEKVQKKKGRCGESSRARYKLCSLHDDVQFNRSRS